MVGWNFDECSQAVLNSSLVKLLGQASTLNPALNTEDTHSLARPPAPQGLPKAPALLSPLSTYAFSQAPTLVRSRASSPPA